MAYREITLLTFELRHAISDVNLIDGSNIFEILYKKLIPIRIKRRVKRDFQEQDDPLSEHFWYVNPYFKNRNDPGRVKNPGVRQILI